MNYASRLGVKEHLVSGKPLTELESVVLFGVTSLTDLVSGLRKEGCVVHSRRIPYALAVRRVNENAIFTPPQNLPIREIQLTEWWVGE